MPRETLTTPLLWQNYVPVSLPSPSPFFPGSLDLVFASDPANGDQFQILGTEILLVQNSDTVAHTFSVNSTPDRIGRTADLTSYPVDPGQVIAIQFSVLDGWVQTDGNVHLQSSDPTLKFCVVRHS